MFVNSNIFLLVSLQLIQDHVTLTSDPVFCFRKLHVLYNEKMAGHHSDKHHRGNDSDEGVLTCDCDKLNIM